MLNKYNKYIGKKLVVGVQTHDGSNIHCFLLKNYEKRLLVQRDNDSRIDGWLLIRKEFIDKITHTKQDQFMTSCYQKEGILDAVGVDISLDTSDFESLINSFLEHKRAIGCEVNEDHDSICIGFLSSIDEKEISMIEISTLGIKKKDPTILSRDDIALIQRGDAYIQLYEKYQNEG